MSDMTPQQAADEVERVMARTMPLRNHEHLRVLIDHARAAAPEGDDRAGLRRWIADQVVDLIGGDFALADVIGDSLVDNIGRTIERALDTAPAPSVAAPPREDEPEDPFEPLSADIERMQTWMDALPSELESAALRSVLAAARRLEARRAAAPESGDRAEDDAE